MHERGSTARNSRRCAPRSCVGPAATGRWRSHMGPSLPETSASCVLYLSSCRWPSGGSCPVGRAQKLQVRYTILALGGDLTTTSPSVTTCIRNHVAR
jgi:hypothetical protein